MDNDFLQRIFRALISHPVVWSVIFLNIAAFVGIHLLGVDFALLKMPADSDLLLLPFYWWKMITPAFLHFTFAHLAVNLYFWWDFGSAIESYHRWRMLVIFLIAAMLTSLFQYWFGGPKFGGLSGVVFWLLGYLMIHSYWSSEARFHLRKFEMLLLLGYMLVSFTGWLGPSSHAAHLGGLLGGGMMAVLELTISKWRNSSK
ncbi:rhomboid family intramembrane serine protease [Pleionea sp. CnH1-48]|uniref:rhomboid family intramembrane serine protease n=1 Tax=Pleionea sp. CnH1-48 TaxID=2954494 RepID=UPI002097A9D2|nr:rhomboid family intramembrane serine protease [Pleionea sp. CnH1-48]MCO7224607.1 rhomboid family intramembrane serine protease [Pleionea sp. CnH1-48]